MRMVPSRSGKRPQFDARLQVRSIGLCVVQFAIVSVFVHQVLETIMADIVHTPLSVVLACLHILAEDVKAFAELSQDFNPIHLDDKAAQVTPFADFCAFNSFSCC